MKTRRFTYKQMTAIVTTLALATSLAIRAENEKQPAELNRAGVVKHSNEKNLALEHIRTVAISSVDPGRLLPEPIGILSQIDSDADGVPNEEDICPNIPNAKTGNGQAPVCGSHVRSIIDDYVFLSSRTFSPQQGVDPTLLLSPALPRIHALLHLAVPNRILKDRLKSMGLRFVGYVPRNTFMVSVPRDQEVWGSIVDIPGVRGLSALDPADRVSAKIRLYGPEVDEDQLSRLDVEFFADVTPKQINQTLNSLGFNFTSQDETHFTVEVRSWYDVQQLALVDSVKWMEDAEGEIASFSMDSWEATDTTTVVNDTNLRGDNLVVAIGESAHIPDDHPAMIGRVTKGNAPVGGHDIDQSHANKSAAIMVSDGTSVPEALGYLPKADLISYKTSGPLGTKARFYKIPVKARDDHNAALINNSWGYYNCNKIGDYTQKGKWRDKAAYDSGILIVDAAGNSRGENGTLNTEEGCGVFDLGSLPHTQSKNDLMVGNWDISTPSPMINDTSAAGPASDGRLKPDVVAPGDVISTVDYIDKVLVPVEYAGTSAAAPVASGIAGLVYQQLLLEPSVNVTDIPPDQVKAIMIHTARDEGIAGPDYRHGYGLVQAAAAVRIASEWSQWGHIKTLENQGDYIDITFNMEPGIFQYKATLVWTDIEGSPSSSVSLVNDLDLVLISPSDVHHYPWDFGAPGAGDSVPATAGITLAPDRVNNVEQVVASSPNGGALEAGLWRARILASNLIEPQSFSLVLTPPCPIILSGNVTLNGDVNCATSAGVPAVEIVADNSVLDCANWQITGDGAGTGVLISANDVSVTNCDISDVDIAIESNGLVSSANLFANQLHDINRGVVLSGNGHVLEDNPVSNVRGESARGFVISGDNTEIRRCNLTAGGFASVLGSVGIELLPGSDDSVIEGNGFGGYWQTGILLRSSGNEPAIQRSNLIDNEFEAIGESAIVVSGNAPFTVAEINEISLFGSSSPGILVEDYDLSIPTNTQLLNNRIEGDASSAQLGIQLKNTIEAVATANRISDTGVGISEVGARESQINDNKLWTLLPFLMDIAIESADSGRDYQHIFDNKITHSLTGILLSGPDRKNVSDNIVNAIELGISMNTAGEDSSSVISSNNIEIAAQSVTGIGISLFDSPAVTILGNIIGSTQQNPVDITGIAVANSEAVTIDNSNIILEGDAIVVNNSDGVQLGGNTATVDGVAIAISGDSSVLEENTLTAAVGIRAIGDNIVMERNSVDTGTGVGIHYIEGIDSVLRDNTGASTTGTGIRLGSIAPPCSTGVAVAVDNAELENNTITGTPDVDILCDVGAYSIIP